MGGMVNFGYRYWNHSREDRVMLIGWKSSEAAGFITFGTRWITVVFNCKGTWEDERKRLMNTGIY